MLIHYSSLVHVNIECIKMCGKKTRTRLAYKKSELEAKESYFLWSKYLFSINF